MIRAEGVTRRFGVKTGERVALDAVSLDVRKGEIFGVVGRSGAGKSTLVRTFNLLERPDGGRIFIGDVELTALDDAALRAARRRVGMIFQHFNLLHHRNVRRNIALPLELQGRSKADIARRVDQLIGQLGLADHLHKYPAQLSGGQKQRVGIARALACEPDVLLCDEATSALDPETTEEILNLLDDLNRDLGLTIVMITHEMDVIRRVCDRVAVMEAGEIVELGEVADIFLHPTTAASRNLLLEGRAPVAPPAVGERRARLVFRGGDAFDPVLSRVARETGVDFAILSGRIGRLRHEAYGELEIALFGPAAEAALDRFTAAGVAVERLS